MKLLKKIDTYLTDLGTTLAGVSLSLLAVVLMLFPGLVFSYVLLKLFWLLMDSQIFLPADNLGLYLVLGILSWYVGIGIGKITKSTSEINKK